MGTINTDSCLEKIRAGEGKCAVCGKPRYYKPLGAWSDEEDHDDGDHKFIDAGDEPIFVLRAQDVTSVEFIQAWVKRNTQISEAKREEAYALCSKMLAWPKKKRAD